MPSLLRHLALVSETEVVASGDLMKVAAALQKQASRDLAGFWDVSATVDAFGRLEDVPTDYWPIILRDDIGHPRLAGIHESEDGQPYALVMAFGGDLDLWSLTASHEMLEMLVDPSGNRFVAGPSPAPGQDRVNFLVEVADPCLHEDNAYRVNGIRVSDFYTTRYFDPVAANGVQYSFSGRVKRPRQVLPGGYLTWFNPADGRTYQQSWFDLSEGAVIEQADDLVGVGSLRARADARARVLRAEAAAKGRSRKRTLYGPGLGDAPGLRAARLREEIAARAS